MLCPECKTEAAIMESGYEIRGDTSPDTETQLFSVVKFHCRNPKCKKFKEEIGEKRAEINLS